jgi:hypothetical protein
VHEMTRRITTAPAQTPATAGHGPNLGHGYVKYVVITPDGHELPPVVFPAAIAPEGVLVSGTLAMIAAVEAAGQRWWVGEDADLSPAPRTMLAQDRLRDLAFIPALLKGAIHRLGIDLGDLSGTCVTGLPATWAQRPDLARQLGARLREGVGGYTSIRVIAEPLGLMYAALLDNHGQAVGDAALAHGRIGVIDIGHGTTDIAELHRALPVDGTLDTWGELGTAVPIRQIRARLAVDRPLTMVGADLAVRNQCLIVAGERRALPDQWDAPLIRHGAAIVSRLREVWRDGGHLDAILIGGGGAEIEPLTAAICAAFPHAMMVDRPQTAIARGYARLARRLGQSS